MIVPEKSLQESFRFQNPRQERIYRRLLLVGPGPAAFFRDACHLMSFENPLQTTSHLVGHLVREIESAMRDALETIIKPDEKLSTKRIKNQEHKTEIFAIVKALEISEDNHAAQAWLSLTGMDNIEAPHARAHRNSLASPRPITQEFQEFWDNVQVVLDVVLEKFEARFLVSFRLLDELLNKPVPSETDVKILKNNMPNNLVTRGYFFDKANPGWLQPLKDAGFFKDPPESAWPEAGYLARIVKNIQDDRAFSTTLDIILQLPVTNNIRVHVDLAEAACSLPARMAKDWAQKEALWIAKQEKLFHLLPEKLGMLIAHLAKGGQVASALDLASVLLAVLPDPQATEKAGEKAPYQLSPKPQPRFDLWDYEQILKKNIPELITASGEEAFKLLSDLLDSAILLSRRDKGDEGPEDYSYIWRSDIDSQQHYGLKDMLIMAVRDAAKQIVRTDAAQMPKLISILEVGYKWHIFKRIALHLLRCFPGAAPELVTERLLDLELLDEGWCQNEYRQLLKDRFSHLSGSEQKRWFDLIGQGPPARPWREKETISPQELEEEATRWRRERLAAVTDQLPTEWREQHQKWTKGLTVPKDFAPSRVESWVGPTSPKSAQDLRSMSTTELLTFLRMWQPPDDHFAPSPEGLGRQLTTIVAEDSARFAKEAFQFQGLDPIYVCSFVRGLEEACKSMIVFDWSPVLQLCRWIVAQPREIKNRQLSGKDVNPDWGATRQAITHLLSAGFNEKANQIPLAIRERIWEVLEPLTHDPDPTPEYEEKYGGSNMDPATIWINSVRGEAMHTVIRYALWIRRHLEKLPDAKKRLSCGFNEMPEVRTVLDEHLDTVRDPSIAIRAVYGQWFPRLVLLDPGWATLNVPKIFPQDATLRPFLDTAWETYITFCSPYDDVFKTLEGEYKRAVERIGPASEVRDISHSEERLAEHLIVFYWRGKISLDDSNGLLTRFFQKAPDKHREHAIEFIGRSLYNEKKTVKPKILERSKILWEKRLNAVKTAGSSTYTTELIPFGWWFASSKYDDSWSIVQLIEVLKITGKAELDDLVIERLATLAQSLPRQVVQCLQMMVEGDKEGWNIYGWSDHIRSILSTVIQGDDPGAREAAIDLVHRLGALGHLQFRDLLPNTS